MGISGHMPPRASILVMQDEQETRSDECLRPHASKSQHCTHSSQYVRPPWALRRQQESEQANRLGLHHGTI
eukprot:1159614-Pelagomonas_calceolata.AAC.3